MKYKKIKDEGKPMTDQIEEKNLAFRDIAEDKRQEILRLMRREITL